MYFDLFKDYKKNKSERISESEYILCTGLYDNHDKELTYSSINIYRDLHCWEAIFNWIPIGYHKSYTLTIRVKAAILRDLKYEKKKDWFIPEYN